MTKETKEGRIIKRIEELERTVYIMRFVLTFLASMTLAYIILSTIY